MNRNRRLTLSVTESAELLGISRALAYELVARGELPSLQFGRRRVVPWRAIERLLASCDNTSTPEPPPTGGVRPADLEELIPTTEHNPQPRTERDHVRTARIAHAEPASEGSTPTANSHTPNPTHTLAPGVRGSHPISA